MATIQSINVHGALTCLLLLLVMTPVKARPLGTRLHDRAHAICLSSALPCLSICRSRFYLSFFFTASSSLVLSSWSSLSFVLSLSLSASLFEAKNSSFSSLLERVSSRPCRRVFLAFLAACSIDFFHLLNAQKCRRPCLLDI